MTVNVARSPEEAERQARGEAVGAEAESEPPRDAGICSSRRDSPRRLNASAAHSPRQIAGLIRQIAQNFTRSDCDYAGSGTGRKNCPLDGRSSHANHLRASAALAGTVVMQAVLDAILKRFITLGRLGFAGRTDVSPTYAGPPGSGPEAVIALDDRAPSDGWSLNPELALGEAYMDGGLTTGRLQHPRRARRPVPISRGRADTIRPVFGGGWLW